MSQLRRLTHARCLDRDIRRLSLAAFGEFVVWIKARHRFGISDAQSDVHRDFGFLNHAGKVPRSAEFVRRLMIALVLELIEQLFPRFRRLAQQIFSLVDRKRRDTHTRERKMVGAIVSAGFRTRIGSDGQSKSPGRILDQISALRK